MAVQTSLDSSDYRDVDTKLTLLIQVKETKVSDGVEGGHYAPGGPNTVDPGEVKIP